MEKYEVVIVGAGPAGLRAAKILAEAGKRVIVLEKNPVIGPKICAGGVFSKVFQLGIPEDLIERKFYSVKIHLPGKTYEIKSRDYLLSTVDRENLGQWLAKEAENAGAKILTKSFVSKIEKEKVILRTGQVFYFDYLVGADGGNSAVRKYLKLPVKFALTFQYTSPQYFKDLEIFYDTDLFGAGYGWIFPYKKWTKIGCGSDLKLQTSAATPFSPSQLRKNFEQWLAKMKINCQGAKLESLIISYHYQGHQFGNMFLIGEAAGFVSGLSGSGIYSGLISGQEIAKKILNKKYRPKIFLMLASQKLQEKILEIINANRFLMNCFIRLLAAALFLNAGFFNLLRRFSAKRK